MKRIILLSFILLLSSACQEENASKLRIATAANMQFAMKEIIQSFSEQYEIEVAMIQSSSGKLTAQIQEGAPFHIFVSADLKYPNELFQQGLTTKAPEVYAYGKLVLWTATKNITPSIDFLTSESIAHIALANPKTAPYGFATAEVLNKVGIYDSLSEKLVFGESISQTNQFIISQAAELGFTSKSVVLSQNMKNVGQWIELDENTYTPIKQGVVLIKRSKKAMPEAQKFYDFLFSEKAKATLEKFGYSVPSNE